MGRRLLLFFLLWATGCATATVGGPVKPRRLGTPPADRVEAVRQLVRAASRRHQVPEELVLAVIQVESSFRTDARSHAGARGLMQLMPRTAASLARRLGREQYDIEDPAFNIEAGTAYLAYLLRLFDGDVELALAGYNTGPMRVRRWVRQGRGIASRGVRRYAATVLAARDRFRERGPASLEQPAPAVRMADEGLDRRGLRALLAEKEALYGERPDEPVPDQLPALSEAEPASQPTVRIP